MRIGILNTDTLDYTAAQIYGNYTRMFNHFFQRCIGADVMDLHVTDYDIQRQCFPASIDENDAYLITGSKVSVYDDVDWMAALEQFVQTLYDNEKPLIGICFGHQFIARALGGRVEKSKKGWGIGVRRLPILNQHDWMQPSLDYLSLPYSHQDQVVSLPANALCFVGDEFCPCAGMLLGNERRHTVLTFQGHPEFSLAYVVYLLEKRRTQVGEQRCREAWHSLGLPMDRQTVANWIMYFITGN